MGRLALTNLLLLYKKNNSLPNIWFSMLNFERIDRQEFSIAGYSYSVAYSTIKFEYTNDSDVINKFISYITAVWPTENILILMNRVIRVSDPIDSIKFRYGVIKLCI